MRKIIALMTTFALTLGLATQAHAVDARPTIDKVEILELTQSDGGGILIEGWVPSGENREVLVRGHRIEDDQVTTIEEIGRFPVPDDAGDFSVAFAHPYGLLPVGDYAISAQFVGTSAPPVAADDGIRVERTRSETIRHMHHDHDDHHHYCPIFDFDDDCEFDGDEIIVTIGVELLIVSIAAAADDGCSLTSPDGGPTCLGLMILFLLAAIALTRFRQMRSLRA